MIIVGGLPVHHDRADDAVAEAYAMVLLVESGFARRKRKLRARSHAQSARCDSASGTLRAERDGGAGTRRGLASRSTACFGQAAAKHRETQERGVEQPGDRATAGCQREGHQEAGGSVEVRGGGAACPWRRCNTPASEPSSVQASCAAVIEASADHPQISAVKDPAQDSAVVDGSEPVPMSLDRDASDRSFDRQLAYLGVAR